jgi:hypothetical protein
LTSAIFSDVQIVSPRKFPFPNCQNFPFQTVKISLSKDFGEHSFIDTPSASSKYQNEFEKKKKKNQKLFKQTVE